jgi:hypothetical protein
VPFYKRARLADLALAFDGEGYGRFEDLAELTAFADNPGPTCCAWKVCSSRQTGERIDAGELLEHGSARKWRSAPWAFTRSRRSYATARAAA